MEILGVGPSELVFIVILALIILGPKDMQKAGKTIGKWLRSIVTSDGWRMFMQTSQEIRTLPNRLMREANEELNTIDQEIRSIGAPSALHSRHPSPARPAPLRSQPLMESSPKPAADGKPAPADADPGKEQEGSSQQDA